VHFERTYGTELHGQHLRNFHPTAIITQMIFVLLSQLLAVHLEKQAHQMTADRVFIQIFLLLKKRPNSVVIRAPFLTKFQSLVMMLMALIA
jgi:hypothetical protein